MPPSVLTRTVSCGMAAVLAAACTPGVKLEDIQASAAGAIQNLPAQAQALIPKPVKPPKGSATDIYARIARGAHKCWLGIDGPLKGTHLFQAEAKPQSEGGAAQVDIHERIDDKPNVPGRRVFFVTITPVVGAATVYAENVGLPKALATAMKSDVDTWAADDEGCAAQAPLAEEGAAPPDATAEQKPGAGADVANSPSGVAPQPVSDNGARNQTPAR